jgi:hypothetical protein
MWFFAKTARRAARARSRERAGRTRAGRGRDAAAPLEKAGELEPPRARGVAQLDLPELDRGVVVAEERPAGLDTVERGLEDGVAHAVPARKRSKGAQTGEGDSDQSEAVRRVADVDELARADRRRGLVASA